MSHVFICHSSKDKDFVRRLSVGIESFGMDVWLDENELAPGDSLSKEIPKAIEEAQFCLAVISSNSVQSKWVEKELSLSFMEDVARKGNFIIPVLKEYIKELPRQLRDIVYADFTTDWNKGLSQLRKTFTKRVSSDGSSEVVRTLNDKEYIKKPSGGYEELICSSCGQEKVWWDAGVLHCKKCDPQ